MSSGTPQPHERVLCFANQGDAPLGAVEGEIGKDDEVTLIASKEPNWADFQKFIMGEVRYNSLMKTLYKFGFTSAKQTSLFCIRFARIFPEEAKELFSKTEQFAKLRYEGYKKLSEEK